MNPTLEQLVSVIPTSNRVRIIKDDEQIFCNWRAMLDMHEWKEILKEYAAEDVKKFSCIPDITHRQWKEKELFAPVEPDKLAEYKFSDLQMSLYYTIYI